jgi:hypothetical protein
MIERGQNYSVRIFMNSHQPIPKASISKLFGDANISNGHRIVDIARNPKMDNPGYIKQIQHLLCHRSSIDLIEPAAHLNQQEGANVFSKHCHVSSAAMNFLV